MLHLQVLHLGAMLPTPGCNTIPNELSSLFVLDGHQSACRMLGLGLVLLECLQDGFLMLVGKQLEPLPAGEIICNGEAIHGTTSARDVGWTTQVTVHQLKRTRGTR